jgi:3-hydroxyisobutyrate dehydrogenase-like beta-hydroxyacid dehydrogenase
MEHRTKPRIGLIGLGLMGNALADRAIQADFSVNGYDLDSDRTQALAAMGGVPSPSSQEIFNHSDWIIYSVMTTDQVRESLESNEHSLRPGQVVIDCSTGEPDAMADLGKWLRSHKVEYLDATVAGNSAETRRGEVLALVGGNETTFKQCRPFFDCFAKESFLLGPNGYGARMKLVFNLVLGLHRAVLGEALGFAQKLDIPQSTALDILKKGSTYSYVMDNKGEKILNEDFSPQAKLSQHLKDVRLMLELGERYGAQLPLSTEHQALLESLQSAGLGELDNCAIVKAFDGS